MAPRETTQISGQVESVNEKGIKLGGAWYNFSKHHTVPAVTKGQSVTLDIEGGKWINGLTVNGATSALAPQATQAAPAPSTHPKSEKYSAAPDETTALRLECLKIASAHMASRNYESASDITDLANVYVEWVGAE